MALNYDDLKVGDQIPTFSITLDQMMLWKYSGASGDFNPIHNDAELGKKSGLGGTIAHGLSSMGRLQKTITDWVGDPGKLKRMTNRFAFPAKPGDTLTFGATIVEKYTEDGKNYVKLEGFAKNQDGNDILSKAVAVVEI